MLWLHEIVGHVLSSSWWKGLALFSTSYSNPIESFIWKQEPWGVQISIWKQPPLSSISCQPLLEEASPSTHHWLGGSGAPPSNPFLHSPPTIFLHSVTRTPRSTSQAIYRGTSTPSPSWKFSWCILCVWTNRHPVVNKYRALLLVLSTACAAFYISSLYSAPNSREPCALFHWILSHFFTLLLRATQFRTSSFWVFMTLLFGIISQVLSAHTKFLHQNH